jgi:hypothetical protein
MGRIAVTGKLKAGFIGAPEYLSGKMREGYSIKHEESETKLKGKESSYWINLMLNDRN